MFELFLSKTPNKEAAPPPLANARQPAKKFSSHFLICARRIFSSKRKRKLFCWLPLLTERAAGAASFCIRSGMAEFPPNPPSAMPPLKSRRAKIPSPQPPSFLPACLGFALKFFCGARNPCFVQNRNQVFKINNYKPFSREHFASNLHYIFNVFWGWI